ncbi:Hypothetical predicted protein [Octopus vulgaris]|uniref:Uncharacterized protein n=1 Tax=Octopus vulgaris TaxID=6645 RepID=A0AA36AH31_OCTVU|nr:Hypothetical predicted protein [Octopus vulgaris]
MYPLLINPRLSPIPSFSTVTLNKEPPVSSPELVSLASAFIHLKTSTLPMSSISKPYQIHTPVPYAKIGTFSLLIIPLRYLFIPCPKQFFLTSIIIHNKALSIYVHRFMQYLIT